MSTAPFNDAQIRHVVATLRHIGELLSNAMQTNTGNRPSEQTPRVIPPETDTALSEMHEELHTALKTWAPDESPSPGQLRWALEAALHLAQIALAELDAKHLGHYGQVNPETLGQLDETRARLEAGLDRVRESLERARPVPKP